MDFYKFDYIGGPWNAYQGMGGDGGLSIRSRKLMLAVIEYEAKQRLIKAGSTVPMLSSDPSKINYDILYQDFTAVSGLDDKFFISRIIEMIKNNVLDKNKILVAKPHDTMKFQAINEHSSPHVFTASGTLSGLSHKDRDEFLMTCPEMKWLYPSLHNPNCFGAHVNPKECGDSICAMKKGMDFHGSC